MKKIIAVLLSVLIFAFSLVPCVGAYQSEREYFEDGSYIIVSDEFLGNDFADDNHGSDDSVGDDGEAEPESGESSVSRFLKTIIELFRKIIAFLKTQKTVTETKYVSYYSSDGELLWIASLTAEFTYNGKSSLCESVKTGCNIYDSDWTLVSKECSKDGNTATAHFKVRQHKLGVPLKVIEKTVTVTCDKDGNIK